MSEKELKTIESNELQPEIKDVVVNQEMQMISMIERAAMNPDVDIDKMERLMAMQEQMLDRQAKQGYIKSMVAAQSEMGVVNKNKDNKQTNSSYADLAILKRVITPVYTKHGFAISFSEAPAADGMVCVKGTVMHRSGHSEDFSFDCPIDDKGIKGVTNKTATHGKASSVSYSERYLLRMIFNLTIDNEDDDGNGAGVPLITEEQANEIHSLITDNDLNMGKFLAFIKQKLKCNSIEEINLNGYGLAISSIQTTIKNKKVAK
jgi:hypothetical protein